MPQTNETPDRLGRAKVGEAHDDGSPGWHRQRRRGLGGSDAAIVLGHEPFGNDRQTLWRRKTGREDPFGGNTATEYGSTIEDFIAERAMELAKIDGNFAELKEIVEIPQHLTDPDHTCLVANIDGYLPTLDEGVEIKTSSQKFRYFDGDCKEIHYPQIQHYMGVTGLDRWHYLYFEVPADRGFTLEVADEFVTPSAKPMFWEFVCEEGRLFHTTIDRDDAFIERLREAELDFWEYVEADEPPPNREPEGEVAVEDDALEEGFRRYALASQKVDEAQQPVEDRVEQLEEQKSSAKQELRRLLDTMSAQHDDAKKIHVGDHSATWRADWETWQINESDVTADEVDTNDDPF